MTGILFQLRRAMCDETLLLYLKVKSIRLKMIRSRKMVLLCQMGRRSQQSRGLDIKLGQHLLFRCGFPKISAQGYPHRFVRAE